MKRLGFIQAEAQNQPTLIFLPSLSSPLLCPEKTGSLATDLQTALGKSLTLCDSQFPYQ